MTDTIVVPRKRCSKCDCEFSVTVVYFPRYKSTPDGFSSKCRGCGWKLSAEEFQLEIYKLRLSERGYKICRDCEAIKPLDEFRPHKTGLDGRRPECIECWREDKREYSQREDVQEYLKEYRRREDVKARQRARENTPEYKALKKIYMQHPERKAMINQQNAAPEKVLERREYRLRPEVKARRQEYYKVVGGLYKKRNRLDEDKVSAKVWKKSLAYFNGCCAICGRPPSEQFRIVADHWHALSKGGKTNLLNLVPLCHSRKGYTGGCNCQKSYKDAHLWLTQEFGEEIARELEKRIQDYFEWVKATLL